MKSAYQIIRRPVITEKGLAIKENQNTLVFQVAPKRDEDGNQASGAVDFQSESAFGPHCHLSGERAAARKVCRLSSRLEEGVCTLEGRREDAGIRAEFIKQRSVDQSLAIELRRCER